jgi:PKD repeat protein
MLLLVIGGLDIGRMFFSWVQMNNAAREGAAYAAGSPTDTSGITSHVTTESNVQGQPGEGTIAVSVACADPSKVSIACSDAAGGSSTGNTVNVTATRSFRFVTPLVSNILGTSINITGNATAAVFGYQPNGGDTPPDACDPPTLASFAVVVSDMTVNLDAGASTPNSGACAISSYQWDMGDGLDPFPPVDGKTASYTYAANNTYTITLTVQNPGGSLTTTQLATVPPPLATPTPTPTPTPTSTATPTPSATYACTMVASFTYNETGNSGKFNFYGAYTGQPAPTTWYWTYGDGTVAFGQAPTQHRYSGSGPYTVNLTITSGSCVAATSQTVTP